MTRAEKFYKMTTDPAAQIWKLEADKRAADFILRRAEQNLQLRYWSKFGHDLPKARKIVHKAMPCT
jgi:hypothetical protein